MITKTDQGDVVELVGISSLDDRRRIVTLETRNTELEAQLAHLRGLGRDAAAPALEPVKTVGCYHLDGNYVDMHAQRLTCRTCGAPLDPYDVLRRIARREFNFCYTLKSLRIESAQLTEEVKRLKAARARLRREIKDISKEGT